VVGLLIEKEFLMTQDFLIETASNLHPVRAEHLDDLREQIDDAFDNAADVISQLQTRFAQLAECLQSRFAAEEQSGWFDEVLCRAPWLTPRAQELQQQHVPLVETVRQLERQCFEENNPVVWWEDLRRRFEELSEMVLEHEEGHDSLLQEMHPEQA
jgi:hypothetical protein